VGRGGEEVGREGGLAQQQSFNTEEKLVIPEPRQRELSGIHFDFDGLTMDSRLRGNDGISGSESFASAPSVFQLLTLKV
jgi:hypothetical protein